MTATGRLSNWAGGWCCAAVLATCFLLLTSASTPAAPKQTARYASPESASAAIWSTILTRCGPESYFYGGSFFDASGALAEFGAANNPSVIEFRGVKFDQVPIRITDADKLNGIEYHARIVMLSHVYRYEGRNWEDGPALQVRDTKDIFNKSLQLFFADMGELGAGGAMALDLMKFKGAWYVARTSITQDQPMIGNPNYYELSKAVNFKRPPTCSELGLRIKRGLDEEASERTKDQHDKLVYDAWHRPGPAHDPNKGIPFLLLSDADLATLLAYYGPGDGSPKDDPKLLAALKISQAYPVVPDDNQWLPVGTKLLTTDDSLTRIDSDGGGNAKPLMVVTITSGPLNGKRALIEAANYGYADRNRPSQVWSDPEEPSRLLERERRQKLAEEKQLVRDPVKGIPFEQIDNDTVDQIKTLEGPGIITPPDKWLAELKIWDTLDANFQNRLDAKQWLSPGTEYDDVCHHEVNGICSQKYQFKSFVIIFVKSGPYANSFGIMDSRNDGVDLHVICPTQYPSLSCDKP